MNEQTPLPNKNPPYYSSVFPNRTRHIVTILSYLLSYYSNQWLDETIIGFISILSTESKPSILFNFNQFLAYSIHEKFVNFVTEEVFQYSSVFVYMFFYFQANGFQFSMSNLNEEGEPQSVIFWATLVMKYPKYFSYKTFVEIFLHPGMSILSGTAEPRISEEIRRIMLLTYQERTGDWYLYQNYTELRVYGCDLAPYKLPKFLPTRIFSLEYIKQMINADEVHFVAAKKKLQFRIKSQIFPFICNNGAAGEGADKILKEMNFTHSFTWSYNPWGIISKKMVENNQQPIFTLKGLKLENT